MLFRIANTATGDGEKWRAIHLWVKEKYLDGLIDEVRELGVASHEQKLDARMAKAMHDLRGGALSALLGRLQLLDRLPQTSEQLKTLFILTRDHLKIMRSALSDLDEARHAADLQPKSHAMHLILDKWKDSVVGPKWEERPVRMSVDCRYEGALTECCLESAAVDRIFYNLANNACRHVAGNRLDMVIFPTGEARQACLRFVLSNMVSEADAVLLRSLGQTAGVDGSDRGGSLSLGKLFEPEVSSTGSGYGLTVVADFVAGAFGLSDRQEALRERYVGAVLEGRTFRVWFHWPTASNDLPQKRDDYHQPDESLSEP